jgi:hypothetical protein
MNKDKALKEYLMNVDTSDASLQDVLDIQNELERLAKKEIDKGNKVRLNILSDEESEWFKEYADDLRESINRHRRRRSMPKLLIDIASDEFLNDFVEEME